MRRICALADKLEVLSDLRALLCRLEEGLLGTDDALRRECHLAAGPHRHALELADCLAGRRHHAADPVDLVAEELDSHRACCLCGEHIDRISMHPKGTRYIRCALGAIAHADKKGRDILEGHLIATRKRARRKVARALGRHAAQERGSRCHDDAGLPCRKARYRMAAGTDDSIVVACIGPGIVPSRRIARDRWHAEPGSKGTRGPVCRLLACHDQKARTGMLCPERCQHKRTCALGDRERQVVSFMVLMQGFCHLGRRKETGAHTVYEHRCKTSYLFCRHNPADSYPEVPR